MNLYQLFVLNFAVPARAGAPPRRVHGRGRGLLRRLPGRARHRGARARQHRPPLLLPRLRAAAARREAGLPHVPAAVRPDPAGVLSACWAGAPAGPRPRMRGAAARREAGLPRALAASVAWSCREGARRWGGGRGLRGGCRACGALPVLGELRSCWLWRALLLLVVLQGCRAGDSREFVSWWYMHQACGVGQRQRRRLRPAAGLLL
jgi:hypothetical protein